MNKPAKIVLGVATLWMSTKLLIGAILSLEANFYPLIPQVVRDVLFPIYILLSPFSFIVPLSALTFVLLFIILLAIYIIDVFKEERISKYKKILWAVALFLISAIAMPIYWYRYIWKDSGKNTTNIEPQNNISPRVIARSETTKQSQ